MNGFRSTLVVATVLAGCLLAGCAGTVAGAPVPIGAGITTGVTTGTVPPPDCTEVIHGDPWITFEASKELNDGEELVVGERGFLRETADGLTVTGTGMVAVTEQSADTEIRCGVVTGSVTWVEVVGIDSGEVTFGWDDRPGSTVTITVVTG